MSVNLLKQCVGTWEGTCQVWFSETDTEEGPVQGVIEQIAALPIYRFVYTGMARGKTRHGEETLAWNSATETMQVFWFDSFHMSQWLLISLGPASETGFKVTGHYDVGPGEPPWGWRTEYHVGGDELRVEAFNIMPSGEEMIATRTILKRVPPR